MEKRIALVTGGTRGIGLGCAETLAREGWDLSVCGVRSEEDARESLDKLRGLGAEVQYLQADVGEDGAPERLIQGVRSRYGRLDLLVNNAGVAPAERKDILEASPESFDRVLRINLRGPYFLTQAAARFMLEGGARDGPAEARSKGFGRQVHRVHLLDVRSRGLHQPGRVLRLQGRPEHGEPSLGRAACG